MAVIIWSRPKVPSCNASRAARKVTVAVGDLVKLKLTSANQGVIEEITERQTLLYRSDQYKSKLLAANVTQLFIVVATEPGFSDDLVSRSLVAAEAAGVKVHIILNKIDVVAALEKTGSASPSMRD